MENPNPFPELPTLPGERQLRAVGTFLCRLLRFLPGEAPDYMSNHYHPLDGPVEPVVDWPPTPDQLHEAVNRWDDQGNYLNPDEPSVA